MHFSDEFNYGILDDLLEVRANLLAANHCKDNEGHFSTNSPRK